MAKKRKDATQAGPAATPLSAPATTTAADLPREELHARLQSLRPRDTDEVHAAVQLASYLTFWIADELYALPLARAREIVRCDSLTKVPDTPAWLRGVTNIRGTVIPVVDLAPRLGCAETAVSRRTAILLIDVDWTGECMVLGLLVAAVGRVAAVSLDQVEAAPAFGTRIKAKLVAGVIPVDGTFAVVVDVDSALAAQELLPHVGPIEGPVA